MPFKVKSKILIVDDDKTNLMVLEEILGAEFEIRSVSLPDEAIMIAKEMNPDIILLDIMMPGTDGYEVCKRIRTIPELSFTKIILLSAKSLLTDRLKGYDSGADDFITKPFDSDELLAKVKVFIRLKSVQEIDRVKDDLINLFSHETRTPLNAIIGFASIMKGSDNLNEYEKECAELIVGAGRNLLELVNKTILLSNLRTGTRSLMEKRASLLSIADKALMELDENIKAKSIKIINNLRTQQLSLEVDEELMISSLKFIIENAIKYSPQGGKVELSIRTDGKGVFCDIKDYGKGISRERSVDRIFSEFYVEDLEHHGRGHGLSLVIVKHIMGLHGGKITAVNNKNEPGSTFSLFFPSKIISSR